MIKLTFTGDIMCEKNILTKKIPEKVNFQPVFNPIKPIFRDSDLVIGNLETVFAGAEVGYSKKMFSFNTPDSFLDALAQIPVHFVTTANNHALDRKKRGLVRTIEQLDKRGILHTGTNKNTDNPTLYHIIELKNIKIAIMSLTASINYYDHYFALDEDDEKMINLMAPQDFQFRAESPQNFKLSIFNFVSKVLGQERFMKIRKWYGGTWTVAYDDPLLEEDLEKIIPYAKRIKEGILKAKKESDFLVICPHMGGQFNIIPGSFSEWYMNFFRENGADLVIGNHPHLIQKAVISETCPIFYSLGNFSMYPDSTYILKENKPEIGLIVHVYLETQTKKIKDISCVPVQMSLDNGRQMRIDPLLKGLSEQEMSIWIDWLSRRLDQKLVLANNELFLQLA